jgi:hypothetical protein
MVSSVFTFSDGGSDSSVSDGPPVHLQYNLERVSSINFHTLVVGAVWGGVKGGVQGWVGIHNEF